jgi:hypothetical protein
VLEQAVLEQFGHLLVLVYFMLAVAVAAQLRAHPNKAQLQLADLVLVVLEVNRLAVP